MDDSEYKRHLEEIARESYEKHSDQNDLEEEQPKTSPDSRITIGAITLPVNIVGFLMISDAALSVFCTGSSCSERYGFERAVFPIASLLVAIVSLLYNIYLIKDLKSKKQLTQSRTIPVFLSFIPIALVIIVFIFINSP